MTSHSDRTHETSTWTDDELVHIGSAVELQISSRRTDGSLRRFVTIWTVIRRVCLAAAGCYWTGKATLMPIV